MNGRRRPQRVRVLSDNQPKVASEAASASVLSIIAVEMSPGATPRKMLKTRLAYDE